MVRIEYITDRTNRMLPRSLIRPLVKNFNLRSFSSRYFSSQNETPLPNPSASYNPPITHHDSMTRFPEVSSRGFLRFMDYFGTSIFAISGTCVAGHAGMDLLGCTIVGSLTAVGGGSWRDVVLRRVPFWVEEQEYFWIALVTSASTFFLWKHQDIISEDGEFMFWTDSASLGAFAVIASMNSIRSGFNIPFGLAMAAVTCTGGGVTRDVLTKRPVRIMHNHAEVYALTASAASLTYLLLRHPSMGAVMPVAPAIFIGIAAGTFARWAAVKFDLKLPKMNFNKPGTEIVPTEHSVKILPVDHATQHQHPHHSHVANGSIISISTISA